MTTSATPLSANSERVSTRDPIRTREVGRTIIALFIGVATGLELLLLKIQRSAGLGSLLAGPDWKGNLFFYAALLLLAVWGVLFGIGRLRPVDVGLERKKLLQGILVTASIWLLDQAIGAVSGIPNDGTNR